jgi:hypothetical protein
MTVALFEVTALGELVTISSVYVPLAAKVQLSGVTVTLVWPAGTVTVYDFDVPSERFQA